VDANLDPNTSLSFVDSSYTFIVRIINPCIWKTFKTDRNYLTADSVPTLYGRVLDTDESFIEID
jgi:hypothetical protein